MTRLLLLTLMLFSVGNALAAQPQRLEVSPPNVELSTARDRQSLNVLLLFTDGSTRDVTAEASYRLDQPVARIEGGVVAPLANGKATLTITHSQQSASIPVVVTRAGETEPLQFRNDVLAVLTRVGCNTGKCHGSASGKDGFRLSLFGYDPDGDYFRLTRESGGRRVNLADPDHCLLINKALGKVPHTGGQRITPDSEYHQILTRWLEAGAKKDPADTPRPVSLEVFPRQAVFAARGSSLRLVVRARYSDGTDRDVTRFSVFLSNNEAAVSVKEDGTIQGNGPGEAFILARFDEFTEGSSVIVRPGTPFTQPKTPEFNYIDRHIHAKLNKMHLLPSDLCSDEVFLRRVYLDVIGQLPTPAVREKFLADTNPKKREQLVDQLLEHPDFRDIWVMKWAELLQIRTTNGISPKGLQKYDRWLRDRIRAGATLDVLVKQLLPATGGSFENPAVSYYQTETTPQLIAENVAQVFLGTRIQCAQCHNHPFDRWTMEDFYGFAAFFSQVGYKQAQDPRELTVFNTGEGEMRHPVTNRPVAPKFLGSKEALTIKQSDYRKELADWIARTDHPAFTQNLANIVWAHFFGRGIIDPVDDVRVSNPPSNPELLAALGQRLTESKLDIKALVRDICTSRTYQLSTQTNKTNAWDNRNFSRQTVRRLRAEILLDCITQVTETTNRLPGLPTGGRAIQIPDGRAPNYFLATFGRAPRDTACSCEVKVTPTLSQALHLINGDTTNTKITEGQVIEKLLASGKTPMQVAEELYLRCFGRKPTTREAEGMASRLSRATDPKGALEDLFWAILSANEFIMNR